MPALMARANDVAQSVLGGAHNLKKAGQGDAFWQYREYDPSDRPQDIDWRQSGKTDRVFVRQKEKQSAQKYYIWAQHNHAMDYQSDKALMPKQEAAHILSLALAQMIIKSGDSVCAYQSHDVAGRSEKAMMNLLISLTAQNTDDVPRVNDRHLEKNAGVILVGDFLAPLNQIEELTKIFARIDKVHLIQLLDPAERSLAYQGRMIFQSPSQTASNKNEHLVENVQSVRATYQKRLDDHIAAIKNLCMRQNWSYFYHQTDSDIRDTLYEIYGAMNFEDNTIAPNAAQNAGGKR